AARGAGEGSDRVRLAARGLRGARQGSRLPEEGQRLHRRCDRCLSRAEDGRGRAVRDDAAPDRVRHVLQRLTALAKEWGGRAFLATAPLWPGLPNLLRVP